MAEQDSLEASVVLALINKNEAVERGILLLRAKQLREQLEAGKVLSSKEDKNIEYYSSWLSQGKPLSGKFLTTAREITIAHKDFLVNCAKARVNRVLTGF